jgi:phosphoribosylglycinamide formyltransferase 1
MQTKIKIAILISGRGSNLKALIEASKKADFPAEISLVISNKAEAKGLEIAENNNIKTTIINHKLFLNRESFDKKISDIITENKCDLICLAGFMRILSADFIKKWQRKIINIHPSLLPEFKGANAVHDAINAKAKHSGCSVHYVTTEVDSGEIIAQEKVEIKDNDDIKSLSARILKKEHILYPRALEIACKNIR